MELKDQIRSLVWQTNEKKPLLKINKQANDHSFIFSMETFVKECEIILVFKNIHFEKDLLIIIIISK